MSLTVAPAAGFDSLASLASASLYHDNMGNVAWALALPAVQESYLRRATQYVLARRIKPEHLAPVHPGVMAATCEAALRVLDGKLYQDVAPSAVTEKTIGPITQRFAAPTNGGQVRFPVIDDLLRGLTLGGAGQILLVRA